LSEFGNSRSSESSQRQNLAIFGHRKPAPKFGDIWLLEPEDQIPAMFRSWPESGNDDRTLSDFGDNPQTLIFPLIIFSCELNTEKYF
jgi:hypothetical protein